MTSSRYLRSGGSLLDARHPRAARSRSCSALSASSWLARTAPASHPETVLRDRDVTATSSSQATLPDDQGRHISSFQPFRMSQALTGMAVKKPTIIDSCMRNQ